MHSFWKTSNEAWKDNWKCHIKTNCTIWWRCRIPWKLYKEIDAWHVIKELQKIVFNTPSRGSNLFSSRLFGFKVWYHNNKIYQKVYNDAKYFSLFRHHIWIRQILKFLSINKTMSKVSFQLNNVMNNWLLLNDYQV